MCEVTSLAPNGCCIVSLFCCSTTGHPFVAAPWRCTTVYSLFFIGAIVVNVAFYDIRSNERFIQQIQQTIMLNSGKAASANTLVENDATSVSPVAVVINDDSYEETSPNDACVIARVMEQHEATLHSYPPLSNVHVSPNKDKPQSVPHLASLLCEEKGVSSYHVNKGPLKNALHARVPPFSPRSSPKPSPRRVAPGCSTGNLLIVANVATDRRTMSRNKRMHFEPS